MGQVAIITDSAANLPPNLVKSHGIQVVPLKLIWDGQELRDGVDITPEEFYARLPMSNPLPTTSTYAPEELLQIALPLAEQHEAIVAICLAHELSGSFAAARAAQDAAPALPLHVVDSRTAAMAEGFVALEAARTAQAGGPVEQVLDRAREMTGRVHLLALLESLEYLRRGGRVAPAVAFLSSIIRIKPIMHLPPQRGSLLGVARPRTWSRAVPRMVELMAQEVQERPIHVAIGHGDRGDAAADLAEDVRRQFDVRELFFTNFTPVMGAHAGPVLSLAFWAEDSIPA